MVIGWLVGLGCSIVLSNGWKWVFIFFRGGRMWCFLIICVCVFFMLICVLVKVFVIIRLRE